MLKFLKGLFVSIGRVIGIVKKETGIIIVSPPTPTLPSEPTLTVFNKGDVGVDISHHNTVVDLPVLANNVKFIYMKATEGVNFVSKVYAKRSEELKALGVKWGAYHYFRCLKSNDIEQINLNAVQQAKHFLKYIDVNSGLPPVLDIEAINNTHYNSRLHTEALLIFLQHIEEVTGITPIIYTNFYFARDKVKFTEDFKRYPLWLAWYTKDLSKVQIPYPWENMKLWQHTELGTIKGVQGKVDLNIVIS